MIISILGIRGILLNRRNIPIMSMPIELRYVLTLLFLASILFLVFFLMSLQFGFHCQPLLDKLAFSLGGRALSFFLIKMGFSGGLALLIGMAFKAVLADDAHLVLPDEGTSQRPLPDLNQPPAEVAPDPDEHESLRRYIHDHVYSQLLVDFWKRHGKGHPSAPDHQKMKDAALVLITDGLGLSAEADTETLRIWVEDMKSDPKLIKPLISEYRPFPPDQD